MAHGEPAGVRRGLCGVLRAFLQWLLSLFLAPSPEPALVPDVVECSEAGALAPRTGPQQQGCRPQGAGHPERQPWRHTPPVSEPPGSLPTPTPVSILGTHGLFCIQPVTYVFITT